MKNEDLLDLESALSPFSDRRHTKDSRFSRLQYLAVREAWDELNEFLTQRTSIIIDIGEVASMVEKALSALAPFALYNLRGETAYTLAQHTKALEVYKRLNS